MRTRCARSAAPSGCAEQHRHHRAEQVDHGRAARARSRPEARRREAVDEHDAAPATSACAKVFSALMWNSGSVVQSTSSPRRRGCARCSRPTSGTARAGTARPWPGRWCPRCRGSRAVSPGLTRRHRPRRCAAGRRRRAGGRDRRRSPARRIADHPDRSSARRRRRASRSTNASSITSSRAPLSASKYSICGPIDAVLIGTATAPIQPQPRTVASNSTRLPHISATRSPRATPARRSAAPRARARPRASACDHARRRSTARPVAERARLALQHRRQRALRGGTAARGQSSSVPPPR